MRQRLNPIAHKAPFDGMVLIDRMMSPQGRNGHLCFVRDRAGKDRDRPNLRHIGVVRPSLLRMGAGSATRAIGSLRVGLLLTDCYASRIYDQSLPERRSRFIRGWTSRVPWMLDTCKRRLDFGSVLTSVLLKFDPDTRGAMPQKADAAEPQSKGHSVRSLGPDGVSVFRDNDLSRCRT